MNEPLWYVKHIHSVKLLNSLEPGSVDAIITSPPYTGLPGRANTISLVKEILEPAVRALNESGTITMIVGPSPGNLLLPLEVAQLLDGELKLQATYIWDRTGALNRDVGTQTVSHDMIIVAKPTFSATPTPTITPGSVVRTQQEGFNYGTGVTTPPVLAEALVNAMTEPGDLIVDPFCGLGEIGVQSKLLGRRFIGGDIDPSCIDISMQRLNTTKPRILEGVV